MPIVAAVPVQFPHRRPMQTASRLPVGLTPRRGEGWLPGQVAEAEPPAPCSQEVRPLTGVCLVSPKPGEPARLVFGEARDPAVLRWV